MKIRIAKKEDFEQYLELNRKSLREYSKISLQKIPINNKKIKKEFDFIFKNQRRFMLVSEENRIITGYLIWILLTDTFQKTGYVDDLFIKKEFRKKGIAKELIKKFIKVAKNKGVKKFRLNVNVKNKKAIKLYNKFGFKITHYEMQK
ncbi:MAG: GNAT family N-acetyltransferase [Nanoarchaeota archaeon]